MESKTYKQTTTETKSFKHSKETDKLDALKNPEIKSYVDPIKTHGKEGEVIEHPPIVVTEKPIVHETHVKRDVPVESVTYIHKQPVVEKRVEVIHEAPIEKDLGVKVQGTKPEFRSHHEEVVREKAPIHHRQEVIHEVPIVEKEIIEERSRVKPVQVNVEHPEEVKHKRVNHNERERFETGESYVRERREEAPRVVQETHITEKQPIINEEIIIEKPTVKKSTEVRYEQPTHVEGEVHHVQGEHRVGGEHIVETKNENRIGGERIVGGEHRIGGDRVVETKHEHIVEHEHKGDKLKDKHKHKEHKHKKGKH